MVRIIPWESYTWLSRVTDLEKIIARNEIQIAQQRLYLDKARKDLAVAKSAGIENTSLPENYGERLLEFGLPQPDTLRRITDGDQG